MCESPNVLLQGRPDCVESNRIEYQRRKQSCFEWKWKRQILHFRFGSIHVTLNNYNPNNNNNENDTSIERYTERLQAMKKNMWNRNTKRERKKYRLAVLFDRRGVSSEIIIIAHMIIIHFWLAETRGH